MKRSLLVVAIVLILGLASGAIVALPVSGPAHNPVGPAKPLALPRFLTQPKSKQTPYADLLGCGQYLVRAGDRATCRTPKNFLGSDMGGKALHVGNPDEWVAQDLTANTRAGLGARNSSDIDEYLKSDSNRHADAGGPTADVVTNSISLVAHKGLISIAANLKDQPATPSVTAPGIDAGAMRRGKAIYDDVCASCHMLEGGGQPRVFPPIAGNFMLQQRDPSGLLYLILAGGRTAPTPTRPTALSMPSFAWKLTDQQVADVSTYIRNSWGNRAEPVNADAVAGMRKRLNLDVIHRTDNSGDGP